MLFNKLDKVQVDMLTKKLLNKDNFEMKALIDYYRLASKRYKIEPLEYLA